MGARLTGNDILKAYVSRYSSPPDSPMRMMHQAAPPTPGEQTVQYSTAPLEID
jgi:hypothetical protein